MRKANYAAAAGEVVLARWTASSSESGRACASSDALAATSGTAQSERTRRRVSFIVEKLTSPVDAALTGMPPHSVAFPPS